MSDKSTPILSNIISGLPLSRIEFLKDEFFGKTQLNELLKNVELKKTIELFFENDLNILKTAKQSFMHRNTLVYRIEKIKKLTGLDIRHFDDALVLKVVLDLDKAEAKAIS